MGELGEMPSDDDKALLDNNKKRKLKTRSQLKSLEIFYDEHKYPTESMKLLVAGRIGLSEKQISSWFCHRRLKDKKISNGEVDVNGRHGRLSGIRQDLGSGIRQDSCGSTKQSNDRNQGRRIEVQSRRINGQEVVAVDTSSGSSSSPQNMYHDGDTMHMVTSKLKGERPRSGPFGYLKVMARVENAAITALKRQLGALYREDGPSLGIEFDPLPPRASATQTPSSCSEDDENADTTSSEDRVTDV